MTPGRFSRMQGCSPSHSRPHRFGSKSRHLRSRLRVNEGRFGSGARRACTHKRSRTRRGRARARESPAARVDASTRRRVERPPETRARRASFVAESSPPRTRVDRDPGMAKGGSLFSAAAEPPPKQARTPTRRKLDMLASDDAASAREDDAVDEAVENAQLECATRAGTDVFANQNRPGVRLATERERVWRLLLGNVVRAVDEVYLLCEMECGAPEIEGTTSLLEACAADFENLLIRVGDQEKFLAEREASRDKNADDASREAQALVSQQKTSISWDVGRVAARPSDASRDMIRAVVDADKDADKDAAAGGWRPARGKRGERRRERDAGRARRRERRRSKTEDEIEKNDSDEAVLGQTSREDKREDKLRIADRTRTRAFTPGSKPDRASRPPRPAANARASNAATENKKPPVGTHDSAIPDDAQKRTDSRVDSVESLGSLSGKLAASGASASSFGSWADSDDDDALFHETPFPHARAPSSSAPSPPPAVWGAKRDWGAILAPAGAARCTRSSCPPTARRRRPARPRRCFWSGRRAPRRPGRAPSRSAPSARRGCATAATPRSPAPPPPRRRRARARRARGGATRGEAPEGGGDTRGAYRQLGQESLRGDAQNRGNRAVALAGHRQQESRAAREAGGGGEAPRERRRGAPRRRRGGGGRGARRRGAPRRRGDAQAPARGGARPRGELGAMRARGRRRARRRSPSGGTRRRRRSSPSARRASAAPRRRQTSDAPRRAGVCSRRTRGGART